MCIEGPKANRALCFVFEAATRAGVRFVLLTSYGPVRGPGGKAASYSSEWYVAPLFRGSSVCRLR